MLVYVIALTGKFIFGLLPLDFAVRLGGWLGRCARPFCGKIRKISLINLDLAYGDEKTRAEKEEIIRRMFDHLGRSIVETLTNHAWTLPTMRARIECDEHIQRGKEWLQGNGLIVITAHMGSWELFPRFITQAQDLPGGIVARDLHNPLMEKMLYQSRESEKLKVLMRGKSGRSLIHFLRENNALGILGDQDTRLGPGIFVDFFGRPTYTQLGVWRLAKLAKSRVIVAFIVRQPDGLRHRIEFERELTLPPELSDDDSARQFTQEFTRGIEAYIRKHPEQWIWFHQRWRRQPAEAGAKQKWIKGDPFINTEHYKSALGKKRVKKRKKRAHTHAQVK